MKCCQRNIILHSIVEIDCIRSLTGKAFRSLSTLLNEEVTEQRLLDDIMHGEQTFETRMRGGMDSVENESYEVENLEAIGGVLQVFKYEGDF